MTSRKQDVVLNRRHKNERKRKIATCNEKIKETSSDNCSISRTSRLILIALSLTQHTHYVSLMSGAKSSGLAYLFALIGGVFGLHHLYLGRTKHALLWLTTFGGFGLGILDEIFFRLKNYIDEENNEHFYVKEYKRKMQECKSPAFEFKRFIGKNKS